MADDVEDGAGDGAEGEEGHADEDAKNALIFKGVEVDVDGRVEKDGEQGDVEVDHRACQVKEGFGFDLPTDRRFKDAREEFKCGLDRAFGPAVLLAFEGVDFWGKFGGAGEPGKEKEFPASKLCSVGEVDVFGECVVLPAATVCDGLFTPDASCAVEVDPCTGAVAGGMFDDEMAIEEDSLAFGEERVIAVDVSPLGLDHAEFGIGKEIDGAFEEVFGWDEVGVEDGDKLAGALWHSSRKCASFVAGAISAVDVLDVDAAFLPVLAAGFCDQLRVVSGVVEDLDLEFALGVVDLTSCIDDALDDSEFVKHGELYGDLGEVFVSAHGAFSVFEVFTEQVDQPVAVKPVE